MSFYTAPSSLDGITKKIFNKFKATIFCSATLTTEKEFDFYINQMGLNEFLYNDSIKFKKYSSPYYYNDQTRLFIIDSEHDINSNSYIRKISEDIIEINNNFNKRILVLCTSFKQIYDFEKNIKSIDKINNNYLFQRKGSSRDLLLDEYITNNNSILFGTNTFWEGIDLPNDKLELLIIFKLPFNNPSDPFVQANIDYYLSKNLNPFISYQVEEAILKLKQGFGRLIRSSRDMGVCIITDPRITKKKYGKHIIDSLPVDTNYYTSSSFLINEINKFLN